MYCQKINNDWARRSYLEEYKFSVTIGVNVIDNTGGRDFLGLFKKSKQMAFSSPYLVMLKYNLNESTSITSDFSFNKFIANEDVIDSKTVLVNKSYFSSNVGLIYNFDNIFNSPQKNNWFQLYVIGTIGVLKIENLVPSYNFGLGSTVWITPSIGVNFIFNNKFVFKSQGVRRETNHFQYLVGLEFRIPKNFRIF